MSKAAAVAPARCGARKKRGRGTCQNVAGFKTDHVGQGKCYLHGGLTPIKHGRYSSIRRVAIRELIEQHAADPDPLNILPELAAARALFQDFIERYDAWTEALLAWHASWRGQGSLLEPMRLGQLRQLLEELCTLQPERSEEFEELRQAVDRAAAADGRPTQVLDISDAYRIVSEVTRIVERIEKIRSANHISRPDLLRVMTEMGRVVETFVRDDATLERIRSAWLAIRVA